MSYLLLDLRYNPCLIFTERFLDPCRLRISFTSSNNKKNHLQLEAEILATMVTHYLLCKSNYNSKWLRTREVMNEISSDISIYKTRHLLLKLKKKGYVHGFIRKGTQGLCWQLTVEYQKKLVSENWKGI